MYPPLYIIFRVYMYMLDLLLYIFAIGFININNVAYGMRYINNIGLNIMGFMNNIDNILF